MLFLAPEFELLLRYCPWFVGVILIMDGGVIFLNAELLPRIEASRRKVSSKIRKSMEVLMRWPAWLFLLLVLSLIGSPVHPQLAAPLGRCGPTPPDPNWPKNQLPVEPAAPIAPPRSVTDMAKLQREAGELAELSASVPGDLQRVDQGLLPKDLMEKLKRVEKLSRHLRSELTR